MTFVADGRTGYFSCLTACQFTVLISELHPCSQIPSSYNAKTKQKNNNKELRGKFKFMDFYTSKEGVVWAGNESGISSQSDKRLRVKKKLIVGIF